MPKTSRAIVLLLAASLSLAGCTAGSTSTSTESGASSAPTSTVAPATGDTVAGTGYSFAAPDGWSQAEKSEETTADVLVADMADEDGFADNMNVLVADGVVTPEQVESEGIGELENVGATNVTVGDRITVAGSESAHLSAGLSANGVDYQIEQYYAVHDEKTYIVTFSFSPSVPVADRDELASSVLATWAWS